MKGRIMGNNLLQKGRVLIWMSVVGVLACACEKDKLGELCFVGDSLVAGWDVSEAFPTYEVRNDGVSGACLEELSTWGLNYCNKTVVMLIGANNLHAGFFNQATRPQFIADFITQYEQTIYDWSPRRVFVISILPRAMTLYNLDTINNSIQELNAALSAMTKRLPYTTFVDVYNDFLYEGAMNMNYSLDGLHLNDLGYNVLSKRLSQEL